MFFIVKILIYIQLCEICLCICNLFIIIDRNMNKNIKYFQKEEQNKKLSSHSCGQSQFIWNVSKH